jgi:hypothetical protein
VGVYVGAGVRAPAGWLPRGALTNWPTVSSPYTRILSYENKLLEQYDTQELLEQFEQHLIQEFWANTQEETKATTLTHDDELFLKFKTGSSGPKT